MEKIKKLTKTNKDKSEPLQFTKFGMLNMRRFEDIEEKEKWTF